MEKEWDVFKQTLKDKSGLSNTTVSVILEFIAPLVVYICARVILEPFDLEPPTSHLIPAVLTGALFWLVITHYLAAKPFWLAVLVGILLLVFCVAFFKLWVLYHTRVGGAVSLRVPLFVIIIAILMFNPVTLQAHAEDLKKMTTRYGRGMRLAAIYADTAKDKWRLHIVRGTGLGICGVLLAAAVFRAEDWYLVTNAFFGPRIADQRVGILLAPYNNDPKDTARGRLRADLRQLLDSTPELAAEAQILPLPRPIPGYHPEEPAEQAEAAQLIGAYNRAGAVVYGAAVGEQTGYLVNTQVKLINPPAFLAESLTVSRVDLNPPTNDARFVHLEAAMVAASTALTSDRCGIAEHLFDEAAAARRDIPDAVPTKKDNDLLSVSDIAYWIAMSIDCQLASGVSVSPESVARALRLLDAIPSDPKSTADMRVRALSEQAYIHRHLAERRTNIDDVKQELKLAIDAYTRALEAAPKDHAGIFVAAAQNSRGVTRVELEKHIDRRDEAGRRALLAGARQDYDAANSTLRRPVARERAASRSDRLHLGTTVGINQAVVVFRLGTLENNPDRIEEAIRLYTGLLSDVAETPRLETTLRNNLGDAYFVLAGYHDAPANYRAARVELEHGLAASGNAEPLVSTDLISKIGYVNISLGRIGADPAGQRRGIAALGCAYRLSRAAGLNRQADSILAGLGEEQRRLAPVIYSDALHSSTPYRVCQAT